jgi:NAD(P)-dependent dehydrogenase (short-subunit alcohol dehydrogenase family)
MIAADDDIPDTVLLIGGGPVAEAISFRLRQEGVAVLGVARFDEAAVLGALAGIASLGSLVMVCPEPSLGTPLMAVTDSQLEVSLSQFLDLFGALHLALPRLLDGGAVLAVGTRGHLGAWGGAHEMAFSGAMAGLLRSVALENMDRGVRANTVAVDLPGAGNPAEVADLVHFLLSPAAAAVNGELILANAGASLKMREARDRRVSHRPHAAS